MVPPLAPKKMIARIRGGSDRGHKEDIETRLGKIYAGAERARRFWPDESQRYDELQSVMNSVDHLRARIDAVAATQAARYIVIGSKFYSFKGLPQGDDLDALWSDPAKVGKL